MISSVTVCNGCCCGRVDRGNKPVPLDELKQSWKDNDLTKIEKFNKLEKDSLVEDKLFSIQNIDKDYKNSQYKLYKKLLKEVLENQIFKTKLEFNDKQKILAKCAEMAYYYPADNKKIRPKNFKDPVFKTKYTVDREISNIDRTVWINEEKSQFIWIRSYGNSLDDIEKKEAIFYGTDWWVENVDMVRGHLAHREIITITNTN